VGEQTPDRFAVCVNAEVNVGDADGVDDVADVVDAAVPVAVAVVPLPLPLLTLYLPDDPGVSGGETIVVVEDCSSLISFFGGRVIGYMMETPTGYYYYQNSSYCSLYRLKPMIY